MKKYHIFTLGCQMNESDSERISTILDSLGLKETSEAEADLIVANACSVRQKPIDRIWGKVKVWSKRKPKPTLILTGCVLENDLKKLREKFDYWFKIEDLQKFTKWLARKVAISYKLTAKSYLEITPNYQREDSAFVPIITGCDSFCSYCVVPYARGREWSREEKDIVQEIECLVKKGYKEIVLLGQNVCSYKAQSSKLKSDFVELLEKLIKIRGDFEIKFLSPHPKNFSGELIDLIGREAKLSKEIHLPLQSGDDKILKKMNRNYTGVQYLSLVKKLREEIKGLKLSTDIMVGFPGETKEQFKNSIRLVKSGGFEKAFISMYSPRAGTMASKMEDSVSLTEKRRRWRILDDLINKKVVIKTT